MQTKKPIGLIGFEEAQGKKVIQILEDSDLKLSIDYVRKGDHKEEFKPKLRKELDVILLNLDYCFHSYYSRLLFSSPM